MNHLPNLTATEREIILGGAQPVKQSSLFDHPAPLSAKTDPWTSAAAGRELTISGMRAEQKLAVLKALQRNPGTTSAELAHNSALDRHLVARRLPDLRADDLVTNGIPQETRICAVTGRPSLVWRLK